MGRKRSPQTISGGRARLVPLIGCLAIILSGCASTLTVKHVDPGEPNVLGGDERVVVGRVVFVTHCEEAGEVCFPPCALGLLHAETGRRAQRGPFWPRPWFDDDGTFIWILPTGSYEIDALGWGFKRGWLMPAPDPRKPRRNQISSLKPGEPPECGFAVRPNVGFTVSGENGALYIGSLIIDMNIKKEHGIQATDINRFEIRDEYEETLGLLKARNPSFTLAVEKRLMTSIPDRPVSVESGHCPSGLDVFMRELATSIPAMFLGGAARGAVRGFRFTFHGVPYKYGVPYK